MEEESDLAREITKHSQPMDHNGSSHRDICMEAGNWVPWRKKISQSCSELCSKTWIH